LLNSYYDAYNDFIYLFYLFILFILLQVLAKIIMNKNLFSQVASFCLRFVNKSGFGRCHLFVNRKLDEITPS